MLDLAPAEINDSRSPGPEFIKSVKLYGEYNIPEHP